MEIDIDLATMPIKDIIESVVLLCRNNRTEAAKLLGISRQRMDYLSESGIKNQELISALERARKALQLSKSAFWDRLNGARK